MSSQLMSQYFELDEYCWLEQTNLEPIKRNIKISFFKTGNLSGSILQSFGGTALPHWVIHVRSFRDHNNTNTFLACRASHFIELPCNTSFCLFLYFVC